MSGSASPPETGGAEAPKHRNITVSKKLVAINSASYVIAKVINVSILLWMYQYLLARISVDEFAVYPVIATIIVFGPLFFAFLNSGISRYVIDAYAKGEFDEVVRITSSIFPLILIYGLLFLVIGGLFSYYIDLFLNFPPEMLSTAKVMSILVVANLALQMIFLPFTIGFHVKQRYVELNIIGVGRDVLRIILLVILLVGVSPSVIWIVVATVISELAHLLLVVGRSRFLVPELRFRPNLFEWKTATVIMAFGFWTTIGHLGNIMYTHAATIVLNLFGTSLDVTNYYLGSTLFRQIHGTVKLASQPLQPALTAMHSLEDNELMGRTVLRGGRYALWVSLAVACPLAIYSGEFVQLYLGDKFQAASVVVFLFMVMFPFIHPSALLPMTAIATAQVKAFYLAAFITQLIGLALMYYFAVHEQMGAIGVTLSLTAVTVISQLIYFWPLCLKLAHVSTPDFVAKVLKVGYMPAAAASVVWFGLHLAIAPASWLMLGVCVAVGGLVYLAVLFLFCLDQSERGMALSFVDKIRNFRTA